MKNIVEAAVRESNKATLRRNGDVGPKGLRLRWFLGRLVQDLPAEEAYLAVSSDAGCAVEAAHDATTIAIAPPGEQDINRVQALRETVSQHTTEHPNCQFVEGDFFQIIAKRDPFPKPVGLYLYAGARFPSNLRAAVIRARPFLAPQAIVVFDNWSIPSVRSGTWEGIDKLRPEQACFYELGAGKPDEPEGFGNGCGVFYLTV